MSSFKEINRQIEKVDNDIEKVAKKTEEVKAAITKLENDSVESPDNNYIWERRLKRLDDELRGLVEEKKSMQAQKTELQAQKTILLEERKRQSDWNYGQFMDFFAKVSFVCNVNCTNGTTNVSNNLRRTLDTSYSFKLMNRFENAFKEFKKNVENKFSRKRFNPITITGYTNINKPIEITCHDTLCKRLMSILDSAFLSMFPNIKNMNFVPRPNKADEYSDIYYETSNEDNQVTCSKFVAEVKTRKRIVFQVTDIIEEITKYKNQENEIYQTAGQLLDTKDRVKAVLLTCHEFTYFLYKEEDEQSRIIQISPIIKRADFLHAVLLVLSISYAPITEVLDFNFDKFKSSFTNDNTNENEMTPRNASGANQSTSAQNGNSINGFGSNSNSSTLPKDADSTFNHSGDSGIELDDEYCSEFFTINDLIEARKDRIFLAYGNCGIVSRIEINGRSYADKSCSIFKSKKGILDELRNEFKILNELNSIFPSDSFFPRVYFYGPTFVSMHIVMDFIEGHRIEYFDDKGVTVEVKNQCLKRVEQLHAIRLLHGDLRAPNFIITSSGVFIIDFGRSRFVGPGEEKELESEMANFRSDLAI